MTESTCKFSIGQLVHHRLFDYRGVIADVDPTFQGTEEWYEQMARSRPPKTSPGIMSWLIRRSIRLTLRKETWSRINGATP
jgi:heat shock protein HspQ